MPIASADAQVVISAEQGFPDFRPQRLRIAHRRQFGAEPAEVPARAGAKDDGGGDKRSCQSAPSNLIDAGHDRVVGAPERPLGVE